MIALPPFVRQRRVHVAAAATVVLIGGLGAAWALAGGSGGVEPGPSPSSFLQARPSVTPSLEPSPRESQAPLGELILTSAVETLNVYAAPGDVTRASSLGAWSFYGEPLTLLGTETTVIDGETWILALLPVQPNGTTGWVREKDVTVSSTTRAVRVYLDERILEYTEDGVVVLSSSVVVGAAATPTPIGTFYVTDPLDLSANPTGVYGAYALGLSGFSDTLATFAGGPPQIALHGTNRPDQLGEAVSNGCIRLPNDVVLEMAASITLGTPVIIEQSRASDA